MTHLRMQSRKLSFLLNSPPPPPLLNALDVGAKRETLDMIGRCYTHANYAKAAELHRYHMFLHVLSYTTNTSYILTDKHSYEYFPL